MRLLFLLFLIGYVQCRKIVTPLDKNANAVFINIEGGSAHKAGANQPAPGPNQKPATPAPLHPNKAEGNVNKDAQAQVTPVASQLTPAPVHSTAKPAPGPSQQPATPAPLHPNKAEGNVNKAAQAQVTPVASQLTPAPAHASPKPTPPSAAAEKPTTPGTGSVKQLINFYDSQGKASPIRPYSYSQAVKQGK